MTVNKIEQLETYLLNAGKIEKLQDEIDLIEIELEAVGKSIKTAEKTNAAEEYIDYLAVSYNNLNKKRIELALQKNKLEKDALMFEYSSQNSD